jgi:hypothetical protein
MRQITGLILAALLVLTSATLGSARGQAMAVGQIVICSGQGIVSVTVDAEGNPVGGVHVCPDCVLTLLAVTGAAPDLPDLVDDWSLHPWRLGERRAVVAATALPQMARGPPPLV